MIWLSGCLALMSLLAVFKAPAKPLWFVALGATEWGHWLAIVSLVFAFAGWRLLKQWGFVSWLAVFAGLLFLTPVVRATFVARELPNQLAGRFGSVSPCAGKAAPIRLCPLNFRDLFSGVSSPPIEKTTYEYAAGPLRLDLYRPSGVAALLPGILVVHSGSWQSGDRTEFQELNRYLAARGYLVAAIDYRLAPKALFPAQRDDVFTAIAYLKNHAKEFGLDKDRLVLLGRSAGGQIALSAAYAEKDPAIKGVIVFYAPNDLAWGYSIPANPLIMNSQKVIETYLGGAPTLSDDVYEAASPLNFVNQKTPPTLMIHGSRDELVWAMHDERLSRRLSEAKRPFYYLNLPWATHGCDANFSGPSGQLSTYAIERFLAAVTSTRKDSHG